MDRNTILRWALIALAVILVWKFVPKLWGGGESDDKPQWEKTCNGALCVPPENYSDAPDFAPDAFDQKREGAFTPEEKCTIQGNRFHAELSTRGAALTHFWIHGEQYGDIDLSTTPDHERWRSLRTLFRGKDADDQVKFDRFVWKIEHSDERSCTFGYADDQVEITKVVSANERPFELDVRTTVKNLASVPKKHQLSTSVFAFRRNSEIKSGGFFLFSRPSPFVTELMCASGKNVEHKTKDDFKEGWFDCGKIDRFNAVSSYYFAQALVQQGDLKPSGSILAEDWYSPPQKRDDENAGSVYHAQFRYDAQTLEPGKSITYDQTAFFGPKERDVLAKAGGPGKNLGDTVNLGFFSIVAKVLLTMLVWIKVHVTGNWGLAIIVLTLLLRIGLFPLTLKSIKASLQMRKLKPELDEINRKFGDDMNAKNLAMMELWKKHGYGPLGPAGAGCLPQLAAMPVWFAMYTTLQTAVEMYHTRFLWFTDLSAPDRWFILPFVLIGLMILQQRMVPVSPGMDPTQQKMMQWIMPIMFGGMMLFLPAALGIYMMTSSLLGIVQQVVMNKVLTPQGPGSPPEGKGEIVVKQVATSKG
jgi:YidC/Oxa1 family membrane protein insertase